MHVEHNGFVAPLELPGSLARWLAGSLWLWSHTPPPVMRSSLLVLVLVISYSSDEIRQIQGDIATNTPEIPDSVLAQHHSP